MKLFRREKTKNSQFRIQHCVLWANVNESCTSTSMQVAGGLVRVPLDAYSQTRLYMETEPNSR